MIFKTIKDGTCTNLLLCTCFLSGSSTARLLSLRPVSIWLVWILDSTDVQTALRTAAFQLQMTRTRNQQASLRWLVGVSTSHNFAEDTPTEFITCVYNNIYIYVCRLFGLQYVICLQLVYHAAIAMDQNLPIKIASKQIFIRPLWKIIGFDSIPMISCP